MVAVAPPVSGPHCRLARSTIGFAHSLDGVSAPLEASSPRIREGCGLLLPSRLLLLLRARILATTLTAPSHCANSGACSGIVRDDLANDRPACRSPGARPALRSGRGGRRAGRSCGRRRCGRINTRLLYGPGVALGLVFLLLFRVLALGRVHVLLR
jgi:hypothetical protein